MKKFLIMLFCVFSTPVFAWPERTVTVILPLAPGNGTDVVGRLLAAELSERFKVNFIVENKVGASTTIGTNQVINSVPDGYTLLFTSVSLVGAKQTLKSTKYVIERDLIPITIVAETPMVLVVSPKKFQSVQDLIAAGQTRELSYGTIGYGGSTHFMSANFTNITKIKNIVIPYKGTQDSLIDLMMGRVDFMFTPMQATKQLHNSGNLKIIGVVSDQRSPILPDVLTFKEMNLQDVYLNFWVGLFAPKNVSIDIIEKLSNAVEDIKKSKSFRSKLEAVGVQAYVPMTNQQFFDFLRKEEKNYIELMNKTGVEAQ